MPNFWTSKKRVAFKRQGKSQTDLHLDAMFVAVTAVMQGEENHLIGKGEQQQETHHIIHPILTRL